MNCREAWASTDQPPFCGPGRVGTWARGLLHLARGLGLRRLHKGLIHARPSGGGRAAPRPPTAGPQRLRRRTELRPGLVSAPVL